MTNGLVFDNVSLRFGSRPVLQDVSLRAGPGEVVGLVGPNGAGKTSIARVAAGFTQVSGGLATMDGTDPRTFRVHRGIGYAPEELPRVGSWTVRSLLAMRTGRLPSPGEHGAEVIRTLGLQDQLATRVTRLSKGQWRLVLLAYAALDRPRLLILDEPDSGLDPGALNRLAHLIELARASGCVVLVLSHQLFELERSCDRALFVREGRVVAEESGRNGVSLRTRYLEVFA